MPRKARIAPGGLVYHVWNRAVGRVRLFRTERDYLAFERVLDASLERLPLRVLDYCIMPNHFHFVVWPRRDGELSAFFRWMTHTHAMRWRVSHHNVGYGPVYQGRFKSLPVQEDAHLLTLCRYVERNPVACGLVKSAQQWRWGSLWVRQAGTAEQRQRLTPWPVERPRAWIKEVNTPLSDKERDGLAGNEAQPALRKRCVDTMDGETAWIVVYSAVRGASAARKQERK